MSAVEDRPDDPAPEAREFTITNSSGNTVRTVLKTPESIRANRALLCSVYKIPDDFLDDVLECTLALIPRAG